VNPKSLRKVKQRLQEMLRSPSGRKPDEMISLAKQLGRSKDKRGKEPTYVRERDPALSPPLSIPNHGEFKSGTARSIINALLSDVDDWELYLLGSDDGQNEPDND
jgi:hypothetical protein